jgi:hypothetical protein
MIASLDLGRWSDDERDILLLQLMTICLETDLFTALTYICLKGSQNFTLPLFSFLKKAVSVDQTGDLPKKKKYILRCLWYIKNVFKRRMLFEEGVIPDEKMKIILRDMMVILQEKEYLKLFYDTEPELTTSLLTMIFSPDITAILEDTDFSMGGMRELNSSIF